MTTPKLALIPCGYKASKVYSVLPTDGVGDFDFTRSGDATRVNSEGLIETVGSNVPRLNYPLIDGVVSGCPSLLLEPARTNLIDYSEDFSNAYWTKSGSSVIPNTVISPDGTTNAFKLVEDSATSDHYIGTQAWATASLNGQDYTISCFAKRGENNFIQLLFSGATHDLSNYVNFDLLNGVVGSSSNGVAKIEAMGNGWYKCSFTSPTITAVATSQSFIWKIESATSIKSESYQGDGTSGVYIWGAQVEVGSYPTSYIPTSGSTATRSAETCNNAGDVNTFNDSEGVLFLETAFLANDLQIEGFSINDGSVNNKIAIFKWLSSNTIFARVKSAGTFVVNTGVTITDITQNNKIAFKYKVNDFALWINGVEVLTQSIGAVPIGLADLDFSSDGIGGSPVFANTKQLQYFNTALNDSDLETLTSWTSFSEMATSQLYTIE